MKNLKKVLALGLALVMILGMFTIASAAETKKTAADLTDWDKVEHKDAVALCVDLGIINGLPDGSFAPDQTIDRASWAKLVYFTATGDDNADAYLGTNSAIKDIKGNWAESYINYLVANKYVSGDNLGNYNPTGAVTVAAGLKTMLTVLGYDAEDRGYQNNDAWMGNIMTDAKRNNLMDNVDRSQTAAVNLTRENAAQIVYNALQTNIVEGVPQWDAGNKYITTYNKKATLGYDVFGILRVTGVVDEINSDGYATFKDKLTFDNNKYSVNKTMVDGKVKATASSVGEEVVVFVQCTGATFANQTGELGTQPSFKSVVSTTVAKTAATPAAVYTNGVKLAAITTEYDKDNLDNGYDKDVFVGKAVDGGVSYYVNGDKSDGTPADPKRGEVAEVYTNGEGEVTTIKITNWKVAQLGKDVETRTVDGKTEVRVNKVVTSWTDASTVEGWQGLKEDDVVLFYTGAGSTVIEKADKVNGKVNRRNGGDTDAKLTINGTQYQQSGITGTNSNDFPFATWDVAKLADNEYDFYLDKNGTVCYVILIEGETKTETAYVLQATYVEGSGSLTASKYAEAELLFTDGSTQIVNVAKIGGLTPVDSVKDSEKEMAGNTVKATLEGKLIEFSVNSKGNYEVTIPTNKEVANGSEIKAESTFTGSLRADDKTVFLVQKGTGDDAEFHVFTGKDNVPGMTLTAAGTVVEDKDVVTYAFLQTEVFEGEVPDGYIYVADVDDFYISTDGLRVHTIYNAEGEKTTMAIKAGEITTVGFYKVDKVNEADGNELETVITVDKDLTKIGNGIVVIGEDSYSYDKSTVCVVVDLKKDTNDDGSHKFEACGAFDPASFSLETEDYDYVAVRDSGDKDLCSFIYVIRTALN